MGAVIVGRGAELAALRKSMEDAGEGRRRLVLISGEPGIGKSRLLDEFAGVAAATGAEVAWGRCWEAGGAPAYWPWTELLRETLRTRKAPELETLRGGAGRLSQLLPELHRSEIDNATQVDDPDAARFLLFEAVAEFFRIAAETRPLVLLLDDLHAADESSLLLLQFLAAEASPAKLLLAAAYRDVELLPDRPLTSVARDLTRLPATTRLTLTGLTRDEVAELTELTTSVAPSAALAARLRDQTDGNPLYVGEVVRLLAAEGRLEDRGFERLTLPRDVRETVLLRLERLTDETKQTLAAASVFGRDFRIDVVGALSGTEDPLASLAEAEAANLVTPVADKPAQLRFSHAVVAEALYDELPLSARLDLHWRAGNSLERLFVEDLDTHLAELARHYCAAVPVGDTEKAVDYSLRAGDRAVQLLAYEEGVRLYGLALSTIEATAAAPPELRSRALRALGDAQARAGDSAAAKSTFLRAAELARRTGNGRDVARAALGYGGRFAWFRAGTDTRIVPLLWEALAAVPEDDAALRARLLARLSGALRDEPSREERDALSAQAVAIAREIGDHAVNAYALTARYTAIWGPDSMQELESIGDEMEREATASQDSERLSDAHLLQFVTALTLGRIGDARRYAERCAEFAETLRQPAQRWYAALLRSILVLLAGDLDAAEQLVEETRLAGQRAQQWDADAARLLALPIIRWEQGRLAELEEDLLFARNEYPGYRVFGCMLALLYAETGRLDDAKVLLSTVAPELPKDNNWLAGMMFLSEVAAATGDDAHASRLYAELAPYAGLIGMTGGEQATGAVDRCLGQLATVVRRFDDAERHFDAALQIHRSMPAPIWTAHTEYDYAQMLTRRNAPGDTERADELLGRSLEACATFGLSMLADRIRGNARSAPATRGTQVFRRDGEYWEISFEDRSLRLRHSKGLEYLAALLRQPHTDIAAIDLVAKPGARTKPPSDGLSLEGDSGQLLDSRARAEYRQRLEDLQAELDEAEEWGDQERAARAKAEIDFLASELAGAVGLGGRPRRTGSQAERARQSVRKAVSAALDRIGTHDAHLARHLAATIRTGYMCRYEPDPRAASEWRT